MRFDIKCDSLFTGSEYLVGLNLRKWMISPFVETCPIWFSFLLWTLERSGGVLAQRPDFTFPCLISAQNMRYDNRCCPVEKKQTDNIGQRSTQMNVLGFIEHFTTDENLNLFTQPNDQLSFCL